MQQLYGLFVVFHLGRWELAIYVFGRWILLWDGFGPGVGCCRKIGPGLNDMDFGKVQLFGLFVSFHGSIPTHVYVASDGSGSNVMGALRMTLNNWCLFVTHQIVTTLCVPCIGGTVRTCYLLLAPRLL